jgi:hypothetical protein
MTMMNVRDNAGGHVSATRGDAGEHEVRQEDQTENVCAGGLVMAMEMFVLLRLMNMQVFVSLGDV